MHIKIGTYNECLELLIKQISHFAKLHLCHFLIEICTIDKIITILRKTTARVLTIDFTLFQILKYRSIPIRVRFSIFYRIQTLWKLALENVLMSVHIEGTILSFRWCGKNGHAWSNRNYEFSNSAKVRTSLETKTANVRLAMCVLFLSLNHRLTNFIHTSIVTMCSKMHLTHARTTHTREDSNHPPLSILLISCLGQIMRSHLHSRKHIKAVYQFV